MTSTRSRRGPWCGADRARAAEARTLAAVSETSPRPVTSATPERSAVGAREIGIVGAGQLARMMLGPATELGLRATVLATDPAESAAAVAARVRLGRHDDEQAVRRLAAEAQALPLDPGHVPTAS